MRINRKVLHIICAFPISKKTYILTIQSLQSGKDIVVNNYLSKFFSVNKGFERGFVETLFMHSSQLQKEGLCRVEVSWPNTMKTFYCWCPYTVKREKGKIRFDRVQSQIWASNFFTERSWISSNEMKSVLIFGMRQFLANGSTFYYYSYFRQFLQLKISFWLAL